VFVWIWLAIFTALSVWLVKATLPESDGMYLSRMHGIWIVLPLTTIISTVRSIERGREAENQILSEIRWEGGAGFFLLSSVPGRQFEPAFR
jgi:hypothetical protein